MMPDQRWARSFNWYLYKCVCSRREGGRCRELLTGWGSRFNCWRVCPAPFTYIAGGCGGGGGGGGAARITWWNPMEIEKKRWPEKCVERLHVAAGPRCLPGKAVLMFTFLLRSTSMNMSILSMSILRMNIVASWAWTWASWEWAWASWEWAWASWEWTWASWAWAWASWARPAWTWAWSMGIMRHDRKGNICIKKVCSAILVVLSFRKQLRRVYWDVIIKQEHPLSWTIYVNSNLG